MRCESSPSEKVACHAACMKVYSIYIQAAGVAPGAHGAVEKWARVRSRPSLARHGQCIASRYVAASIGRAGLAQVHPLPLIREWVQVISSMRG